MEEEDLFYEWFISLWNPTSDEDDSDEYEPTEEDYWDALGGDWEG